MKNESVLTEIRALAIEFQQMILDKRTTMALSYFSDQALRELKKQINRELYDRGQR